MFIRCWTSVNDDGEEVLVNVDTITLVLKHGDGLKIYLDWRKLTGLSEVATVPAVYFPHISLDDFNSLVRALKTGENKGEGTCF